MFLIDSNIEIFLWKKLVQDKLFKKIGQEKVEDPNANKIKYYEGSITMNTIKATFHYK